MTRRSDTPWVARRSAVALVRAVTGGLPRARIEAHDSAVPHAIRVAIPGPES